MKKITLPIPVRYYETDQMAVVHHSNYIRYCETARINFLDSIGIDFPSFERSGFVSPVLSINLDFKRPAVFGDTLNVTTFITEYRGIRIRFGYEITNQKNELLVTGSSLHTFCDKNLKPVALQKTHSHYHNMLMSAFTEE